MRRYSGLLVFFALVACAAWSGVHNTPGPFYAALQRPAWTPPDSIFPPVWAILYFMIAIAGWIVWRAQGLGPALGIWFAQLALNASWSWLMFGRKQIVHALVDISVLWVLVLAFILVAWPVRRSASALFVPYFLWATLAVALNFEIWRLNG